MLKRFALRSLLAGAAPGLLAMLAGCGNRVIDLRQPRPEEPPAASSPAEAVRRLEWSWRHRATAPYQDLFSADYRFVPAAADSGTPADWSRPDELAFAQNLFVDGTGSAPPAYSIALDLDPSLTDVPSPFPGEDGRWHRRIVTTFNAGIRVPSGDYRIVGRAAFTVVRGDSAKIPQALVDIGYLPDSTRWWVERWEDQPQGLASSRATASRSWTIALLKTLYLGEAPPRLAL